MPSETLKGNGYILKENSQVASCFQNGPTLQVFLTPFCFVKVSFSHLLSWNELFIIYNVMNKEFSFWPSYWAESCCNGPRPKTEANIEDRGPLTELLRRFLINDSFKTIGRF